MKKNRHEGDKISQADADAALEILNSPADKTNLIENNSRRLQARDVLGNWTYQAPNRQEQKRRNAYIDEKLGVNEPASSFPPFDHIIPGSQNDTGIIGKSSLGTGLPEQTKAPRDLRTKEK